MTVPIGWPETVRRAFAKHHELLMVDVGRHTGTEAAGDEILQNRCMYALDRDVAGTLVLVTGDGAGWPLRTGFRELVTFARRRGYGVEVLSFRESLNRHLAELGGIAGTVDQLDAIYWAITYTSTRAAMPVGVGQRQLQGPRAFTREEEMEIQRSLGEEPCSDRPHELGKAGDLRLFRLVFRESQRIQRDDSGQRLDFPASLERATDYLQLTAADEARAALAMARLLQMDGA